MTEYDPFFSRFTEEQIERADILLDEIRDRDAEEHANAAIHPMILSGEGYSLTITPEAENRKDSVMTLAGTIESVTTNEQSARAQVAQRALAALRIDVEKSRKQVKEPVQKIGKLIDQTAKAFVADVEAEENRIKKLVGDHAVEVARIKAEREAKERELMEEARRAREAAQAAAEKLAAGGSIADVIEARQADKERADTLAERMAASTAVADAKIADGVRFAWDFEVDDIDKLLRTNRDLVTVTPRRAEIIGAIKNAAETLKDDQDTIDWFAKAGIRAFKKPVVSSR